MVKMAKRPFEELIELLRRELDGQLRFVLRVDSTTIERLFARDDFAVRSDAELGAAIARPFPGVGEPAELLPAHDDALDCLVGFDDEIIELLLYRHPNEVVAVAFDRADDGPLGEFVDRCLAAIR